MPSGKYSGQKLTNPVMRKMPATANSTIPSTPETTLVKNNTPMIAATEILMILSAKPMFFFILIY